MRSRIVLALCALMLSTLTSCANFKLARVASEPPRIDCEERRSGDPTPSVPSFPRAPKPGSDEDAWSAFVDRLNGIWAGYARRLQGGWETEIQLRAATADCLDNGRAQGRWK